MCALWLHHSLSQANVWHHHNWAMCRMAPWLSHVGRVASRSLPNFANSVLLYMLVRGIVAYAFCCFSFVVERGHGARVQFMFCFAILGLQLFGGATTFNGVTPRANFDGFNRCARRRSNTARVAAAHGHCEAAGAVVL